MLSKFLRPKSLDALALRYGTDKSHRSHNFAQFYDSHLSHLRKEPLVLLEIGVGRGASIRMWRKYFPKAKLYAVECVPRRKRYQLYGAEVFIGNQADRPFLKSVIDEIGSPDIIIDDGSHRVDHQQDTFGFLFPFLKPGGTYIIEDIHTSYPDPLCDFGLREDGSNSTHQMLTQFQVTGEMVSPHLSAAEMAYLSRSVELCEVYAHQDKTKHLTSLLTKKSSAPAQAS